MLSMDRNDKIVTPSCIFFCDLIFVSLTTPPSEALLFGSWPVFVSLGIPAWYIPSTTTPSVTTACVALTKHPVSSHMGKTCSIRCQKEGSISCNSIHIMLISVVQSQNPWLQQTLQKKTWSHGDIICNESKCDVRIATWKQHDPPFPSGNCLHWPNSKEGEPRWNHRGNFMPTWGNSTLSLFPPPVITSGASGTAKEWFSGGMELP